MSVVYDGENIKTVVQVLDSNGEIITSATVQYIIYGYDAGDEQWLEYDSGTMNHVGNGVYSTVWGAPSGFYYIYCFCVNPLFNKVFSYVIRGTLKNLQAMVRFPMLFRSLGQATLMKRPSSPPKAGQTNRNSTHI